MQFQKENISLLLYYTMERLAHTKYIDNKIYFNMIKKIYMYMEYLMRKQEKCEIVNIFK